MTKRDYDTVATCLGAALAHRGNHFQTVRDIEDRLKLEFSLDNPRFGIKKFETDVDRYCAQLSD